MSKYTHSVQYLVDLDSWHRRPLTTTKSVPNTKLTHREADRTAVAATAVLHVVACRIVALVLPAVAGLAVPTVRRTVVRVSVLNFAKQSRSEERQQERRKAQDAAAASATVVVDGRPPVAAPHHGRHEAVNGEGQAEGGRVSQGLVGTDDDALAVWRSADRLEHGRHHPGDGVGNNSGRHGTTRHRSTTVYMGRGATSGTLVLCSAATRTSQLFHDVVMMMMGSDILPGRYFFLRFAAAARNLKKVQQVKNFCRDFDTST